LVILTLFLISIDWWF